MITKVKSIITIAAESGILLSQESNGWYKTTCCRHQDEHPTLRIAPDGSYWLCFACRKGGDVTAFVRWCNPALSNDEALKEVYGDSEIDWAVLKALESNGNNDYDDEERGAMLLMQVLKFNLLDKESVDMILLNEHSTALLEGIIG